MTNYGKVYSDTLPSELEVIADGVLVASNIKTYQLELDEGMIQRYVYDYIKYTKDEYIQILGEANDKLTADLLDTQAALCDLYELVEGGIL